jgi:uncharacterized repeat protein (TIGR01451 family)/LPXTG-motif cell wall-anchored protein
MFVILTLLFQPVGMAAGGTLVLSTAAAADESTEASPAPDAAANGDGATVKEDPSSDDDQDDSSSKTESSEDDQQKSDDKDSDSASSSQDKGENASASQEEQKSDSDNDSEASAQKEEVASFPENRPVQTETSVPASFDTDKAPAENSQGVSSRADTASSDSVPKDSKVCMKDGSAVSTATDADWNIDESSNKAWTKEKVKIGMRYEFPLQKEVSVVFTCLPADEADRGVLSIERIKASDLDFPQGIVPVSEYVYDIATDGMDNGTFKYDVSLPKFEGVKGAGISYVEKSIEEVKGGVLAEGDIKKVDGKDIDNSKHDVVASDLDHFTIFMVVNGTNVPDNWGSWENYFDSLGHLVSDVEDDFFGTNDDSNGGTNVSPSEIDIASAVEFSGVNAGEQSSLQYHYDDNGTGNACSDDILYMRVRLEGNPKTSGGSQAAYSSYHWDFLVDANGNGTSDYVVDVFGGSTNSFSSATGGQSGSIGLYPNDPGATTYNTDNVLWTAQADDDVNLYTQVEKEDYGDADADNDQYWMETAVPLSANAGFQAALCGQTNLDGQLFASTSTSNTDPLQKDWMNPVGFFTSHIEHKTAENLTDAGATTVADPAEAGDIIRYTLSVTNDGTRNIPGFVISDDVSDILLYADLVNGDADGNGKTGTVSGGTISWPQQDIAVGQTITEWFTVQIKPSAQWGGNDFTMTNVYGDTVNVHLLEMGTITIVKDAQPNSDQDFSFTTTGTGLSDFFLDDDADGTLSNTQTFADLNPGTYGVAESALSGWTQTSATCSDGSPVNAISLQAGENITCTFVNVRQPAHLTLVKNVTNDNGGTALSTAWTLSAVGPTLISGATGSAAVTNASVDPGTYTLSESNGPSGYLAGAWACTDGVVPDGNGQIVLAPGQSTVCSITNDDQPGTLHVKKVVVNDNGASLQAQDFSFQINGGTAVAFETDGQNDLIVDAGTYTVTEPSIDGYAASYDNCTNVTVPNGGEATCTITNDDLPGTLIVKKHVVNDNNGTATASDFTMTVAGTDVSTTSFPGSENGTTVTMDAGSYSVTESSLFGYTRTGAENCSGTIANGETKTCTFTNDDIQPQLIVIKHVVADNGGQETADDFTMHVAGNDPSPASFPGSETGTTVALNAGEYSVSETGANGYQSSFSQDCFGSISVGQTKTCTITNDDQAAHLIVVKHVINDNGGTKLAGDFTMTIEGVTAIGGNSFQGQDLPGSDRIVTPGSYSVVESGPSGYAATYSAECSGTIALGETKTCTVTNDDRPGTLIVKKAVVNDNGGTATADDFSFSVNGGAIQSFAADGQNDLTVNAGTYTVTEPAVDGYAASYDNCTNVTVPNGGTATCTITNDDIQPKLTVTKVVSNNGFGTAQVSDFPLFVGATSVISGEQNGFNAGTYVVSETNQPGYVRTFSGDCDADGHITLVLGDVKSCTITNDDQFGKIIIEKQTLPDGKTQSFTFKPSYGQDFPLSDGQQNVSAPLVPGTYSVSETLPDGWDQTSAVCSDRSPVGAIDLQDGETVTCVFANTKRGSLTIVKNTVGGDGSFDFTVDEGLEPASTTITTDSGAGSQTYENVLPGTYSIEEGAQDGWDLTEAFCSDESPVSAVDIAPGEDVTCTFTNVKRGRILVDKITDPSGDLQSFEFVSNFGNFSLADATDPFDSGDIVSGVYSVSETVPDGWDQTLVFCSDGSDPSNIDLAPGETVTCTFTNTKKGHLIVRKVTDPADDQTSFEVMASAVSEGETITGDAARSISTNAPADYEVTPGTYSVAETATEGWDEIANTCSEVAVGAGETKECTITNQKDAFIIVKKTVDKENLPEGNEQTFQFSASYSEEGFVLGDGQESNSGDLNPGTYAVSEMLPAGWIQTGVSCVSSNENEESVGEISLQAGETVTCTFINAFQPPVLRIQKSNDATAPQTPGSDVLYTLTVTAPENNATTVSDVHVSDLPPAGFVYRPGTWTASSSNSSHTGDLKLDHVYASPGIWSLGDMVPGETVTLTYVADIDGDQDPGLYNDLAWADGSSVVGSQVLANSSESTPFVGTDVSVETPSDPESVALSTVTKTETETKTKTKTKVKRVLGATLPETGASTAWTMIALALIGGGAGLMVTSRRRRLQPSVSRSSWKSMIKFFIFSTFFTLSLFVGQSVQAASSLAVQIEEPKAQVNSPDFEIGFVAMDILGRAVTVECFKKGSGDASFGVFDSYALIDGGSSGDCVADAAALPVDGTYQFHVTATAGEDTVTTSDVSVTLVSSLPGTPTNYNRDKNECQNVISFTTADDGGKTVKVELYRSTVASFTADASTKVQETTIASNQNGSMTDTVADCDAKYFYAIRAVDAGGYGSGFVGDTNVIVEKETKTKTKTKTVTKKVNRTASNRAIPVAPSASSVTPQNGGEGASSDNEEGRVLGEEKAFDEEGDVLGEETAGQDAGETEGSSWMGKLGAGALIMIVLLGLYAFYRRGRQQE